MIPPTLHELAGIFMLALVTAALISHPSASLNAAIAIESLGTTTIDGVETYAMRNQ